MAHVKCEGCGADAQVATVQDAHPNAAPRYTLVCSRSLRETSECGDDTIDIPAEHDERDSNDAGYWR